MIAEHRLYWLTELSFLQDGWMLGILYGVYADVVVLLFILSFGRRATRVNILTIIFELGAVFFLAQAILGLFSDVHANWFLPRRWDRTALPNNIPDIIRCGPMKVGKCYAKRLYCYYNKGYCKKSRS